MKYSLGLPSTRNIARALEAERGRPPRRVSVGDEPEAAYVVAKLLASRLIPVALTEPCDEHHAAVGAPCFTSARGVCGSRLSRTRTVSK